MKNGSLRRAVFAALAATLAFAGMAAVSASAKAPTITLHFFQKSESFKLTDSAGKPVSPTAAPAVGDVFVSTDVDYVGNHKHHAKQWTASDHIRCVFQSVSSTGPSTAVCDGQVAVGGSMLLADHVTATLTQSSTVVPITGGTGNYRGYRGKATSKSISSKGNDFTIVVHR